MFSKNNSNEPGDAETRVEPRTEVRAERTQGPDFQMRSVSYVGPSLRFAGDVIADEGLVIEGEVEGSITSETKTLTVGKQGRVDGRIVGHTIEIRGTVDGEIYANAVVHLHSTAVVDGALYSRRIIMDEGAVLNGSVDMTWEAEKSAKGKLTSVENTGDGIAKAAG